MRRVGSRVTKSTSQMVTIRTRLMKLVRTGPVPKTSRMTEIRMQTIQVIFNTTTGRMQTLVAY